MARNDDPVHGRLQQAVGPVGEEVGDVDQDGRDRVALGARRRHGNGRPRRAGREDLETGPRAPLEEQGDGAVIGMRTGADVDVGIVVAVLGQERVLST